MTEVAAPASVGYWVLLDQCPQCGGIWCDRWELYPVTAAGADQIDRVDQEALRQPTPVENRQLECPRCRARLRQFRDPSLPRDAHIARCPNCDGVWLNRGELRRFKHRGVESRLREPHVTEKQLDKLAARAVPPSAAAPVRGLANAFEATQPAPGARDVRNEILAGAAWMIARTVLRLLLHL